MPTSIRNLKNQNLKTKMFLTLDNNSAVPLSGHQRSARPHTFSPVLDGSSRVLAGAHSDHDDGEQEEEAGHGEAHAVHRLVAHDDVTVHPVL